MELIQGCRNSQEVTAVQKLVRPLAVVWPSATDCEQALALFTSRRLSHNLGLLDALIGATAMGAGAVLCTFNTKHFSALPSLVTEQPYVR